MHLTLKMFSYVEYCRALYCNFFSEINYYLSLTYYYLKSLLLVSKLFELSPSIVQLFLDMSRNLGNINALSLSLSIVIYGNFSFNQYILFSSFPGQQTFWTWYANHISYFGHLRYIYSARIEGCLVNFNFQSIFQAIFSGLEMLQVIESVNHGISQTWAMFHL